MARANVIGGAGAGVDRIVMALFILGLVVMPLQVVTLGPAQPAHLWALGAVALVFCLGRIRVSLFEVWAFLIFIAFVFVLTKFQSFERVKSEEQLIKFGIIYPVFYLLGRSFGEVYGNRRLPYGFVALFVFLILEYIVQKFSFPVIYRPNTFGQGAIHGTFIERNWLATFAFFAGYVLWLKSNNLKGTILFSVFMIAVTLLSGSKTVLVAVGIAFMMKSKYPVYVKALVSGVGVVLYVALFGDELSGAKLAVRLNEERGLAFQEAVRLMFDHPLGYGVGFVEYHFAHISLVIRGLGLGVNSVFSSPIDLIIVAGVVGFGFWLVFFAGVGLRAMAFLAPVAAWSLINPMHQSEIVYLFLGFLVSLARYPVAQGAQGTAMRGPLSGGRLGAQRLTAR